MRKDRQTDRQTNKQTNKQTDKHSQSCSKYMPLGNLRFASRQQVHFWAIFFTEPTLRSIPADVLPNSTENVIRPYQNLSRRLSLNGNFANVKTLMGILVVWSLNFCVLRTKTQFRNIQPFNLPIYFEVSKWVKFIGRSRTKSVPRVCPPNHKLERVPRLLDSQIIAWVKPLTIIRVGFIGKRTIYQESAYIVVDWTVSFLCCH